MHPILLEHPLNLVWVNTRDIIHYSKDPSLCFSSLSDTIAHFISDVPDCCRARLQVALACESLQKRAIDAM
jgi:hypothetical protein